MSTGDKVFPLALSFKKFTSHYIFCLNQRKLCKKRKCNPTLNEKYKKQRPHVWWRCSMTKGMGSQLVPGTWHIQSIVKSWKRCLEFAEELSLVPDLKFCSSSLYRSVCRWIKDPNFHAQIRCNLLSGKAVIFKTVIFLVLVWNMLFANHQTMQISRNRGSWRFQEQNTHWMWRKFFFCLWIQWVNRAARTLHSVNPQKNPNLCARLCLLGFWSCTSKAAAGDRAVAVHKTLDQFEGHSIFQCIQKWISILVHMCTQDGRIQLFFFLSGEKPQQKGLAGWMFWNTHAVSWISGPKTLSDPTKQT